MNGTSGNIFNAVYPVSGPELEHLLDQGHKPIPLQWVDIDKNEHERREGGPHVAPLFKSRLVSRGDLEETTGVRTDSPTCDIEGLNILLSWASCERLTVKSGDITNAYFQGCPLERLILMRQPPGGVPDVDISADTMFVVRVPTYGTCDAGRGFWKKLRHDILSTGLKENAVIQSKAFVAYCSNNTELQNVFVPQPPQLLAVQTLVMVVDADGNEIGQRYDQSLDSPFDPCQGQSDSPSVSLQEQQVTSSDSLRGQTAMPRVSAQQIDSDDEETAFFAAESFVIDQEHDERVWATLDEGCNAACHSASWAARAERYFDMFGFQSEYREGTRNKVFTGRGGNTVAAVGRRKFPFALAFTAERGDIHHPGVLKFLFLRSVHFRAKLCFLAYHS